MEMIEPGALLDSRYRLEKRIGVGGAGEVWRARHTTLNSIVAVKILHVPASRREVAKKRFLQEARVTAQLRIRQAVQVHDFGFVGERPYLVMELLEGGTLKALLSAKGSLPVRETTIILRQAARALERAHAMNIIHRDFKPDNVFVLEDEEGEPDVRVVDFGIAKLIGGFDEADDGADDDADSDQNPPDRNPLLHFTRTGGMLGTPYYMAPEQVQSAADLGIEVDIWSFGVVAYECLTGKRPFGGENAAQLFQSILEAAHVPARAHVSSLPEDFDAWFDKACAPNPKDRFSDIRTAAATLEEALGVLPVLGPTWFEATDASISFRHRQPTDGNQSNASNSLSGTATAVARKDRSRRLMGMALGGVLLAAVLVGVLAGRQDTRGVAQDGTAGSQPAETVFEPVSESLSAPLPPVSAAVSAEVAKPEPPPVASMAPSPTTRVSTRTPSGKPGKRVADKPAEESEPVAAPETPPEPAAPPENTKPKPPSPLNLPPLGI
jgi:serine/threonine-protein kinase